MEGLFKGERMKFDKSKILTAVTADQAKVGQKGWVGDNLTDLFRRVSECHPITIASITSESMEKRFIANANVSSLFYPAPEPTYRPFNNDELNDLVGEVLTNKQSGRKKLVTGKPTASEGVNLDGSYINAKDLLASFYRNGDESCGVKEEV